LDAAVGSRTSYLQWKLLRNMQAAQYSIGRRLLEQGIQSGALRQTSAVDLHH
jgi:hypothetical protein